MSFSYTLPRLAAQEPALLPVPPRLGLVAPRSGTLHNASPCATTPHHSPPSTTTLHKTPPRPTTHHAPPSPTVPQPTPQSGYRNARLASRGRATVKRSFSTPNSRCCVFILIPGSALSFSTSHQVNLGPLSGSSRYSEEGSSRLIAHSAQVATMNLCFSLDNFNLEHLYPPSGTIILPGTTLTTFYKNHQ